MRTFLRFIAIAIFIGLSTAVDVYAQAEKTVAICTHYMVPPYISDGQQYRALLNGDEIAEFHVTFFGGNIYRIVAASGKTEGNVVFRVYDKERNLLFDSKKHKNTSYWDFKFTSTVDGIIESQLDTSKVGSGFLMMQIGFKQE